MTQPQPFILVPLHTYNKSLDVHRKPAFVADHDSEQKAEEKVEEEKGEEKVDETGDKSFSPERVIDKNFSEPLAKVSKKNEPKKRVKRNVRNNVNSQINTLHNLVQNVSAYKRSRLKKLISVIDCHEEFAKIQNLPDLIMQSIGTRKKEIPNEKDFYELLFKYYLGPCVSNTAKINKYFPMFNKRHWYNI